MKKIDHITNTDELCKHCHKPFLYFWFDKKENYGQSETMWRGGYHKNCAEIVFKKKCKTLQELNNERKHE
jgi:hypothetical protein